MSKLISPIQIFNILKIKFYSISRPVYRSWDDAKFHSGESSYENEKLTNLVFEKTIRYRDNLNKGDILLSNGDAQTLACLGIVIGDQDVSSEVTVLDFGGACGAHYFLAKHFFKSIVFNWLVVETPEMVKNAQCLTSEELCFFSSLEEAVQSVDSIDFVHTSGTLQCIPDPYLKLEQLVNLKSKFLLLSRLGVTTKSQELITIHRHLMSDNGPGLPPHGFEDEICQYPFQFPVKSKILEVLNTTYEGVTSFNDSSGVFTIGSNPLEGFSLFCNLKL